MSRVHSELGAQAKTADLNFQRLSRVAFLVVAGLQWNTLHVSADDQADQDVFAQVQLLRGELELLRFEMGIPEDLRPCFRVKNAASREIYFQALTLFRKADQLAFEHLRERAAHPSAPEGMVTPADVVGVVELARERIRLVNKAYGFDTGDRPMETEVIHSPDEVFREIVLANRQLNLMLDRRFEPGDVFRQVTLAVAYSARLLSHFPNAVRIPQAHDYEPGRRPPDVYRRLLNCYRLTNQVFAKTGLRMLELEVDDDVVNAATPSDVYDIASLLVSELAWLHGQIPEAKAPHSVHYPGRRFPSHVYQRADILEKQLRQLLSFVEQTPDWLTAEAAPTQ